MAAGRPAPQLPASRFPGALAAAEGERAVMAMLASAAYLTHQQKVLRLYKRALRHAESWCVHRCGRRIQGAGGDPGDPHEGREAGERGRATQGLRGRRGKVARGPTDPVRRPDLGAHGYETFKTCLSGPGLSSLLRTADARTSGH